jgi:serine/threonine protein kinase
MPLTVGSRLGHYDVTALIGEGGMGQVYQATDTTLIERDHSVRRTNAEPQ